MGVKLNKGNASATLSLTSLMDVVFLLLIFFMVATKFADEDHKLDVTLPTASEARPLTSEPLELVVGIDQEGDFYVSGRRVSLPELDDIIRQAVANNPVNQTVLIRADKRVSLDQAVQVMDLCNRNAVTYTLDVRLNE